MKYITEGELIRLWTVVAFFNAESNAGEDATLMGFETEVFDVNGEPLGSIKFTEAEYAFIPIQDNADE